MDERKREQEADRHAMHAVTNDGQPLDTEGRAFRSYLETEAREAFNKVAADLLREFTAQEQSTQEANEKAKYLATVHFLHRFRMEHPEFQQEGFERLTTDDLRAHFRL